MTLAIASRRIDPVSVALARQSVAGLEPRREPGERAKSLVAAARPAALEEDHRGRRPRAEVRQELRAEALDVRVLDVVVEVEVVEEPRRLARAEEVERVDTALGRV